MDEGQRFLESRAGRILSGGGMQLFVAQSLACLFFCGIVPPHGYALRLVEFCSASSFCRGVYWLGAVCFASMLLWVPRALVFLRRMALLIGAFMAMIAIVGELHRVASPAHLATALIVAAASVQILSVLFFLLELRRRWRERRERVP